MNKLYYLAHPYTAPTTEGEIENFNKVTSIAANLLELGVNVYSPLTHTHPIHMVKPQSWERWIALDELFMERCDALILCPGWENSRGCRHEKARFEEMLKPVSLLNEFFLTQVYLNLYPDVSEENVKIEHENDTTIVTKRERPITSSWWRYRRVLYRIGKRTDEDQLLHSFGLIEKTKNNVIMSSLSDRRKKTILKRIDMIGNTIERRLSFLKQSNDQNDEKSNHLRPDDV